jgi:DeoR/GlpR family transcriptional regulator of sugar metabolism
MSSKKTVRQETILTELRARPAARLGELAGLFRVSKETIRRDIAEMSERGLLARTYGGALPANLNQEPDVRDRARLNPEGKRRIAELAATLVSDAHVLMIDPGATMEHVCDRLAAVVPQNGGATLTVITNGLRNAMALAVNPAIRIIACPGRFDEREMATFGSLTLEFIDRFRADAVITSAGGINAQGTMDANSDAAAVKRAMMRQSGRAIFAMESRKFNFAQFETVCPLQEMHSLVTDGPVPADIGVALARYGVEVHGGGG